MPIDAPLFNDPGGYDAPTYTRDPDDFYRRGEQGPPYVSSLTKTRKRQGKKADLIAQAEAAGIDVPDKVTVAELHDLLGPEPAWELYSRPSGYADVIDEGWALGKWAERMTVLGIAMSPELLDRLRDDGTADEREILDGIAAESKRIAGADLAKDRGTWVHQLTEWAEGNAT